MIRSNRRSVVEGCEIVNVTDTWERLKHSLPVGTVPTRGSGRRFCLLCPFCGRRGYKLYRPIILQQFACRICHNLTYTSVQKHDARLNQLLKAPDCELLRVIDHHKSIAWQLLGGPSWLHSIGLDQKVLTADSFLNSDPKRKLDYAGLAEVESSARWAGQCAAEESILLA